MKFPSSIRLFILTAAIAQARSDDSSVSSVIKEKFDEWMSKYNKVYSAKEELEHRFAIWKDTDKIIEEHNSQDPTPTFSLGHNSYSDLTLGEFHEHFSLGAYHPNSEVPQVDLDLIDVHDHPAVAINAAVGGIQESAIARKVEELPDAVDWVADGAVTTVKDQGSCGSCWAFSSVGAVEGAKAIYDGELVDLSPQNVMDCDRHLIDNGCNGGNMMTAFHFVKRNVGICTEVDYPYEAENNDECGSESCLNVGGSDISGYTAVELYSPSALMTALVRQPAAVAIDASSQFFKNYKSGVFSAPCGTHLNHGVLAVGYGTDADTGSDYWHVKNSWGLDWGDDGYIKMARTDEEGVDGTCGILMEPSTPDFPN